MIKTNKQAQCNCSCATTLKDTADRRDHDEGVQHNCHLVEYIYLPVSSRSADPTG